LDAGCHDVKFKSSVGGNPFKAKTGDVPAYGEKVDASDFLIKRQTPEGKLLIEKEGIQ